MSPSLAVLEMEARQITGVAEKGEGFCPPPPQNTKRGGGGGGYALPKWQSIRQFLTFCPHVVNTEF